MQRIGKLILMISMIIAAWPTVSAEKPFYDSKSWIVNVAGDYSFLIKNGFDIKITPINMNINYRLPHKLSKKNCNQLAQEMTDAGVGKRYLAYLTSGGWSDKNLKRLALKNVQIADTEFASEHIRSINNEETIRLLAEDYEPILRHNYIVLTRDVTDRSQSLKKPGFRKIQYAIFVVDISKEDAFDIAMNLGSDKYHLLNYPIKYLCSGTYNSEKPWLTETYISKEAPGLAVRGVLLHRNPARISLGANQGIRKGELVSIYSQRVNKKGQEYSKRISRGRVCGVWENEAQINFEAGTAGNRKNGDIVVETPDKLSRWGLMATYSPHIWGGEVRFDSKLGFTRSGIIHHFISEIGGAVTDKPSSKFVVTEGAREDYSYYAPFFANAGIGYGISKTFIGYLDIMPFFYAQYEAAIMADFEGFGKDFMTGLDNVNDYLNNASASTSSGQPGSDDLPKVNLKSFIWGSSVRFPVGVRFGFNLGYPVRLTLEAGYAFRFGFGKDYKYARQACDYIGSKRDGVFVNLGLLF